MTIAVRYAARTDVGLVRSRNEDSGYAGPHLLAVADGMGGHAGGNVASSLVLARLAPLDGDSHGADDALELLADTIADANRSLTKAMAENGELHGMGTTLTALLRCGPTGLALVHIGDSRAFLLRGEQFTQITKDHSFVQSLVDAGRISAEEAEHHPQRSLVTRVLTGAPEDEPDLSMRQGRIGDRYLICSDGLSDYVARDTIEEVVRDGEGVDATAARLVDLALKAGAPDNVTCVVADVVDATSGPPTQPQIVGAVAERRAGALPTQALNPAQKAAALRRQATGAPDEDDDPGDDEGFSRPGLRVVALLLVVLLVLGGAGYSGYRWTQAQMFIGESSGRVTVFDGIPQKLGPVSFASVREMTDIDVDDLPQFYRDKLEATIPAHNQVEVGSRVDELRNQAELCVQRRTAGIACGSAASS
ncbi:PP2C family protein-serine/threonine phosphatase [Agilicoccus flavus]|uniref:PP2C family protein-serine/threonine phosphatase n=1 Tax=Agilicoccus flavus TaxID=2775968 RepID=UPI001CF700CE|nr:PP2C family serine/threonine-protein phosphatase [Agilicoccus flavus]